MGLDDRGEIALGKRADLIEVRLMDGHPVVRTVWRAFDLQLVTYAALLACFGLAMAYSNSATESGNVLESGSVFLRGLMWAGIALVVFIVATAFDYHWLRTLAWPVYGLQIGLLVLTLAIGSGARDAVASGRHPFRAMIAS